MLVPTPEFDPLYAKDGQPFPEKMKAYIRWHFADVLGPHLALLDRPGGLDELARLYGSGPPPCRTLPIRTRENKAA